jgi:hypothetical protein
MANLVRTAPSNKSRLALDASCNQRSLTDRSVRSIAFESFGVRIDGTSRVNVCVFWSVWCPSSLSNPFEPNRRKHCRRQGPRWTGKRLFRRPTHVRLESSKRFVIIYLRTTTHFDASSCIKVPLCRFPRTHSLAYQLDSLNCRPTLLPIASLHDDRNVRVDRPIIVRVRSNHFVSKYLKVTSLFDRNKCSASLARSTLFLVRV